MKFRLSTNIRISVVILAILTLLPVLLILYHFNQQQLQNSKEIAIKQLKNTVSLAAAEYSQINEGARQLLISLSVSPQLDDPINCSQYLAKLLNEYKRYSNLAVANLNGNIICSASPITEPINVSDRYSFKSVISTHDFTVGEYTLSRVTGEPILNFAYPMHDNSGIIYASLDLSWLGNTVSQSGLGDEVVLVIFDRKGTILTRYPDPNRWIGKPYLDENLIKNPSSPELVSEITRADGVKKFYSYKRIGKNEEGPFLAVEISQEAIFQNTKKTFLQNLLISISAGIISLALGWLVGNYLISKIIYAQKEIDSLKRDFVSLVTHQIRTPVTSIKWFTQILRSGSPGQLNSRQKELLDDTATSVNRITSLVGTLLTISKLESGTIPLALEKTSVKNLIKKTLTEIQDIFLQKKIRYQLKISYAIPKILVDDKLIQQALTNLIVNACRYSTDKKIVTISAKRVKKEILIGVQDHGIGIPKEDFGKIWQKFTRGSNAHNVDTEGVGLGLYLSKLIVEIHRGKIWFTSQEKIGTSFFFTIPIKLD